MKKIALMLTTLALLLPLAMPMMSGAVLGADFTLTVTPGNGMARLAWPDVPDTHGYYVFRRVGEEGEFLLMTSNPVQDNTFIDMNAPNNSILCYYVSSADKQGLDTLKSNEACVTPDKKYPTFSIPCKLSIIFQVDNASFFVNGVSKTMKSPVLIRENRTFLLFRHVVEEIGGEIKWDGSERRVDINYKKVKIQLWINKSKAKVDGKEVPIDPTNPRVAPFIHNGYTYVPLRFPVTSLGEGEVKWFGDTRQAVLLFPDRCEETIEGVLQRWSPEQGLGLLVGWSGDKHSFRMPPNIADFVPVIGDCLRISGRNDDPDYPGILVATKAELMDCPNEGAVTLEGSVESVDPEKPSFILKASKGKVLVLADSGNDMVLDRIRRLPVGTCVRATGILSKDTLNAQAIDRIRCLRDTDQFECDGRWVSGWVEKVDCSDAAVSLKTLEGDSFNFAIPMNSDCMEIKPGQCFRACITRGDDPKLSLLFTFDCESPECKGRYIKGKLVRINSESDQIEIAQGSTVVHVGIEGIDAGSFANASCVEACIVMVNSKPVALWVKPLENERCRDCLETLQVKALRIDCKNKVLYAETVGSELVLKVAFESPLFCTMEPEQCYEICIDPAKDTPVALSFERIDCPNPYNGEIYTGKVTFIDCEKLIIRIETVNGEKFLKPTPAICRETKLLGCYKFCVTVNAAGVPEITSFRPADPDECPPDKPKECQFTTIKAKVISTDCKNGKLRVYIIESPWGQGMTLDLPVDEHLKNLCQQLVPGKCYKLCADTSNPFNPQLKSMEEMPCPDEKLECNRIYKGRIVDMNCATNGRLVLAMLDTKITILTRTIDPCKDFKVGECVEACVYEVPGAVPILVSLKRLNPGDCEPKIECNKTYSGKIASLDCLANGKMILESSEARQTIIIRNAGLCKDFKVGECVEACVYEVPGAAPILVSLKRLNPGDCEPKIECKAVVAKIVAANCTENVLTLKTTEATFRVAAKDVDICKQIQPGMCVEACIDFEVKPPKLVSFKRIEKDKCPGECDETVRIKVSSVWCSNRYIEGTEILTIEGRAPRKLKIRFANEEFCRMLRDGCYIVCVAVDDVGEMIGQWFKEIACPEASDCQGRVIDTKIEKLNCDKGEVTVIVDGRPVAFAMDIESCSTLKPGLCVRVCLTRDVTGAVSVRILKIIRPESCEKCGCEGKWVKGFVKEASNDSRVFVMVDEAGNAIKATNKDQSVSLKPGDCVLVCLSFDREAGVWNSGKIIILEGGECKECDGSYFRGVVKRTDCANGFIEVEIGGETFALRYTGSGCSDIKIGVTIIFCAERDREKKLFLAKWIKVIERLTCNECKGRKVVGKIEKYQSNALVEILTSGGSVKFFTDNRKFIDLISGGGCFEVCLVWDKDRKTFVLEGIKPLPPEVCEGMKYCTGRKFKGVIVSDSCENSIIKVAIGGNIWKANISKAGFDCKMQMAGKCVEICGTYPTSTVDVGVIIAQSIEVLPPEKCGDSELDELVGVARKVDLANKSALLEKNRSYIKLAYGDITLKEGNCYRVLGYFDGDGTFVVLHARELDSEECQWSCANETVVAQLIDFTGDRFALAIIGGETRKFRLSESSLEALQKWGADYMPLCVRMCVKMLTATTALPPIIEELLILPASECKPVCSGRTIRGTIETVDCKTNRITLVDFQGAKLAVAVNPSVCDRLKAGMCVRICLSLAGKLPEGTLEAATIEEDASSCGQTCQKISARVYGVTCTGTSVQIKCITRDQRYTITISNGDCRLYTNAKCIQFCMEVVDGKLTGKLVGKVEILPEGNCDDIPDPCSGKLVWNAKVARLDCANGKVLLDHGGKLREAFIDPSMCRELSVGSCYRFCLSFSRQTYTVTFFSPESDCQLTCIEAKVAEYNSTSRRVIVVDSKNQKWMVQLPEDFMYKIWTGMCIKACGLIQDNLLYAQWVDETGCPQEENISFSGVVTGVDCRTRVIQVKTDSGTAYMVKIPKSFDCATLKQGLCVKGEGVREDNNVISAISLHASECPQTWEMYVYDVFCNAERPYIIARIGETFQTVYLPEGFSCSHLSPNACVVVKGYRRQSNTAVAVIYYIEATEITIGRCIGKGPYTAKVLGTSCGSRYIYVEINRVTYKLFYPKPFDCVSTKQGECVSFYGIVNNGYIDCYQIEKTACPSAEKTYKFWMTENACANLYYLGFVGSEYHKVALPRGFDCVYKEGACLQVTGTIDSSTKPPTIKASTVAYDRCPATSNFIVKVTYVPGRIVAGTPFYIKVSYKDSNFVVYSPANLAAFKVDSCININGWISGAYIFAISASAARCP